MNGGYVMKINKNELHSMINQIDDDLLREAQEGYGREKSHMMQRIIPVAACILIMISGIVGAALKNGVAQQYISPVWTAWSDRPLLELLSAQKRHLSIDSTY